MFARMLMLTIALGLSACAGTSAGIGEKERLIALPMAELPLPPGVDPADEIAAICPGPEGQDFDNCLR